MAWRSSRPRPVTVVTGHKPTVSTSDTSDILREMIEYLTLFDAARSWSSEKPELALKMREKFPWKVAGLLGYSARFAMRSRREA